MYVSKASGGMMRLAMYGSVGYVIQEFLSSQPQSRAYKLGTANVILFAFVK